MIWQLMEEWRQCRDAMLSAIDTANGTHNEDDILIGLITGQMRLWRKNKSAVVTEFQQFPRKKAIHVFLAGGDMRDLKPLFTDVENFGRKNGCSVASGLVKRDGWERIVSGMSGGTYMYKEI
jgi:hypothetical protein